MSTFADASALVKLYADEAGHERQAEHEVGMGPGDPDVEADRQLGQEDGDDDEDEPEDHLGTHGAGSNWTTST